MMAYPRGCGRVLTMVVVDGDGFALGDLGRESCVMGVSTGRGPKAVTWPVSVLASRYPPAIANDQARPATGADQVLAPVRRSKAAT